MDFRKQQVSLAAVKETDMVDYLFALGYEPTKIRNADYWFQSPLRDEKTPSFKVNRRLNKWFDHGLGKGGNLIDFGIEYYQCSVSDFLQKFGVDFSVQQPSLDRSLQSQQESESKIEILQAKPLFSTPLLHYLSQRKIPSKIAGELCKEVLYELGGRQYYAIGFKNNSGGYELRNAFTKISSSPKDITLIDNGSKRASVFEGFFDLLSFLAINGKGSTRAQNYIVLNSISFFEKARPILETHDQISLYLDRDQAGLELTKHALSLNYQYRDASSLYENHKDLNEWLIAEGNNSLRNSPKLKKGISPYDSV
ncbi:MAG: DNA primase [Dyadobacter sp. 50-39]|uniref:toprim domain-containing protein n=1 Tax=Dyadobacter sp. 50-39 TaxID=1895756 RepID=UPI000960EAF7|nr:toprim domain-containing protein [Dyadobacter sp. 50-39]OJV21691.1 MAG: DNA primase [Dyadobacter sp. 50-39]